jgi:hypothetical protein
VTSMSPIVRLRTGVRLSNRCMPPRITNRLAPVERPQSRTRLAYQVGNTRGDGAAAIAAPRCVRLSPSSYSLSTVISCGCSPLAEAPGRTWI